MKQSEGAAHWGKTNMKNDILLLNLQNAGILEVFNFMNHLI